MSLKLAIKNCPTAQIFLFCPTVEFNSEYQKSYTAGQSRRQDEAGTAGDVRDIRFHIIPPAYKKFDTVIVLQLKDRASLNLIV